MRGIAVRGSLLLALLALSGCGGSNDGVPMLAAASAEVPAPCSSAFDSAGGGPAAGPPIAAVGLSQCIDAQHNVTIGGTKGCGPNVVIDRSFTGADALGKITIAADGKLAVPHIIPGGTLEVETAGISVAGVLSMGASNCPVGGADNPQGRVKVTFTGSEIPSNPATDSGADKGIEVQKGGILRLFGAKGVAPRGGVNWTQLSRPAGPAAYQKTDQGIGAPVAAGGERRLYLAADVSKGEGGGWKAGDWIVVATSSFSPFESEFVQIASVDAAAGGSVLTLAQPLRHYHFGGADPGLPSDANYGADASTNFGVDERSEVGLISRSISFTSRTPASASADPKDQNHHWGGEIRLLAGFAEASVQGVELEKFGKARLGSYPIHFHMTGKAGPHLIDSNSIHHSYNKCVTVHMSQGVSVTNNVCARAVGHLFYQEMGEEQGGKFIGNLGIGAMSHHFGLDDSVPKTSDGLVKNWWEGDNLARVNGFDDLNVPNKDSQFNPMHGSCYEPDGRGGLNFKSPAPCTGGLYVEQSSGFWIGNPGTVLEGNSIAGCQGTGKAYWYVPPANGGQRFERLGSFANNRAHACFDGLFGEEELPVASGQMFPTTDGTPAGQNVISHFKSFTATRIRNRGVWVRPMWNAVENGRFATNRESVTLVSSGGPDGNGPGVWSLLKDSVMVGISTNNVDRWGPCPPTSGDGYGCVDKNPLANEIMDKGYQSPRWNSAGYMIYDGPVRIIRNHFVNFRKDVTELLTADDRVALGNFKWSPQAAFPLLPAATAYEGDAALGWFQSNQSAYPTATVVKALSFDNVDLRHQIYTDLVNVNTFKDGDKNTAVIDLDGSLTGYQIVDANGVRLADEYPISLNNLPFNRAGNAVDECLATGLQDEQFEGRATSIISPANMASLEFEAMYPTPQSWQDMVFTKDSPDGGVHQTMVLQSRNGLGIWEPKVASGIGYTVRTKPSTDAGHSPPVGVAPPTGMPATVRVGLTDAVKSDMGNKPFHVRVGICYSNAQGASPSGGFTITRGYKSWGGNGVSYNDPVVRRSFNRLSGLYAGQNCFNLDQQNPVDNMAPGTGCPAEGVILKPATGCGGLKEDKDSTGQAVCVFPRTTLGQAASIAEITHPDGTPASFDKYYFDSTTGMLFFYVLQDSPNAKGMAPVGSCNGRADDDPACPGAGELETYFPCPAQGCTNYSVVVNDPGYTPGPSTCDQRAGGSVYGSNGAGGYTLPEPVIANRLAYVGESGAGSIVQAVPRVSAKNFLHWEPARPPSCPITTPPAPAASSVKVTALRDTLALELAQWWRRGVDIGATSITRGSKEWFSARRPPTEEIGALTQICTAKPG